jgi:hypothetical protein
MISHSCVPQSHVIASQVPPRSVASSPLRSASKPVSGVKDEPNTWQPVGDLVSGILRSVQVAGGMPKNQNTEFVLRASKQSA